MQETGEEKGDYSSLATRDTAGRIGQVYPSMTKVNISLSLLSLYAMPQDTHIVRNHLERLRVLRN